MSGDVCGSKNLSDSLADIRIPYLRYPDISTRVSDYNRVSIYFT